MGVKDDNDIFIINGEVSMVIAALKKNTKWSMLQHQDDTNNITLKDFLKLKETLKDISNVKDIDQNIYLAPFLETISCEDTTGPVTRLALTSLQKFIQYNMIALEQSDPQLTIENIAHSLIHARFIGTDPAADEVVLQKILQVMQTLFFSKLGKYLTDQSVCGILHSFFRIAFEMRLAELLRHYSENALIEIFLVILDHIPSMACDIPTTQLGTPNLLIVSQDSEHLNIVPTSCADVDNQVTQPLATSQNCGSTGAITERFSELDLTKCYHGVNDDEQTTSGEPFHQLQSGTNETYESDAGLVIDPNLNRKADSPDLTFTVSSSCAIEIETNHEDHPQPIDHVQNTIPEINEDAVTITEVDGVRADEDGDDVRVNERGVMFRARTVSNSDRNGSIPEEKVHATSRPTLRPYGYSSLNELMRFIINLTNPSEKQLNNDFKVVYALNLLTMAFERRSREIATNHFILRLIKDRLCKNIIELIKSDKLTIVAASLRLAFNLFKSLKHHLKYQMEMFFSRLMEIIASDGNPIVPYQKREYILDLMVQFFKLPNFSADLYVNYDCDLYCLNLLEDWTKLLSKNAFPITGIYSVHLLSLEALFAIIDDISARCRIGSASAVNLLPASKKRKSVSPQATSKSGPESDSDGYKSGAVNSEVAESAPECPGSTSAVFQNAQVLEGGSGEEKDDKPFISIKMRKILLHTGTEHFNTKPSKGIQFLQEAGILSQPLNEIEMARFLRENPALDKKMVAEYLSNRKNLGVLKAFVNSFNFENTRVDQALRMYLEAFRLPGESPLISLMLENFAHHWHVSNGEPFVNEDAAFALAYGIIMLNVDQHHQIVKKQMIPMTCEEFTKNLSKVNGGGNFDPAMLKEIYKAIKSEEIVMPAEQTGAVKDNYLWKVLLRRGDSKEYAYQSCTLDNSNDSDIFQIVWGPTVAASSYVFDKSNEDIVTNKIMTGFKKCALIANHFTLSDVLDKLIITLCKFTNVINVTENIESLPITLGSSHKSLLSLRMVFMFARYHGDILREGWKYIIDTLFQLFRAHLLPDMYVEVDDYLSPTCKISLDRAARQSQYYDTPNPLTPLGNHANNTNRDSRDDYSPGAETETADQANAWDYRNRFYYTTPSANPWNGSFRNRKKRSETFGTGSGLFSSFYSYVFSNPGSANPISGSAPRDPFFVDPVTGKEYGPVEREAITAARACVLECQPENVVWDSKFLGLESLKELFKTLMYSTDKFATIQPSSNFEYASFYSSPPVPTSLSMGAVSLDSGSDAGRDEVDNVPTWPGGAPIITSSLVMDPVHEDYLVFNLEVLVQIIIQNRDRINLVWSTVRSYFYEIIVNHSSPSNLTHHATTNTTSSSGGGGYHGMPDTRNRTSKNGRRMTNTTSANTSAAHRIKDRTGYEMTGTSIITNNNVSSGQSASRRPHSLPLTSSQGSYFFSEFLLERAVVGLLRVATRLARRTAVVSRVIGSLRILLLLSHDPPPSLTTPRYKSPQIASKSLQVNTSYSTAATTTSTNLNFYFERFLSPHAACGLAELVRLNCPSGNISKATDWAVVLACLERVGAAAFPTLQPTVSTTNAMSTHTFLNFNPRSTNPKNEIRSGLEPEFLQHGSSSTLTRSEVTTEDSGFVSTDGTTTIVCTGSNGSLTTESHGKLQDDWLFVKNQDVAHYTNNVSDDGADDNQNSLTTTYRTGSPQATTDYLSPLTVVKVRLRPHNPFSFGKCIDTLAFVVNGGHLTPTNYHMAIAALSTFVEAYVRGRRINSKKFQRNGDSASSTERSPVITGSVLEYLLSCERSIVSPLPPIHHIQESTDKDPKDLGIKSGSSQNNLRNEEEQVAQCGAMSTLDVAGGIVNYYEARPQPNNPFVSCASTMLPEHGTANPPTGYESKQGVNKAYGQKLKRQKSSTNRGVQETRHKISQPDNQQKISGCVTPTTLGDEDEEGEPEDNPDDEDDTYGCHGDGSSDSPHANDPVGPKGTNKLGRSNKPGETIIGSSDKPGSGASFFGLRRHSPNLAGDQDSMGKDGNDEMDSYNRGQGSTSSSKNNKPFETYRDLFYQILDTMYAMQTQAKSILYGSPEFWPNKLANLPMGEGTGYGDWVSNFLWPTIWRPLLKGMSRMCCDRRRQVRMTALTYLQRSLLAADLQDLSGADWENCFSEVLFPLMSHLLNNDTRPRLPTKDFSGIEETRHRAATILSKVFLQHLNLLSPPGQKGTGCSALFTSLWLTILDYMDRFVHASGDGNDMLAEAIPESLKNMLLVMDTSGVFQQDPGLRELTWDRINSFLPKILLEIRFQQEQLSTPPAINLQQTPPLDNEAIVYGNQGSLPNPIYQDANPYAGQFSPPDPISYSYYPNHPNPPGSMSESGVGGCSPYETLANRQYYYPGTTYPAQHSFNQNPPIGSFYPGNIIDQRPQMGSEADSTPYLPPSPENIQL